MTKDEMLDDILHAPIHVSYFVILYGGKMDIRMHTGKNHYNINAKHLTIERFFQGDNDGYFTSDSLCELQVEEFNAILEKVEDYLGRSVYESSYGIIDYLPHNYDILFQP